MDNTMMMLPPAERGKWNREVGEELWRRKKEEDKRIKREEVIENSLLPIYWPFGMPGGGAPNPGLIRRQKFRNVFPTKPTCEEIPNLPAVTKRGKYSDSELRFQFHPDVRKSVDIHWRYRFLPEIKAAYRTELEQQMAEKQQRRSQEWRSRLHQVQNGMTTDIRKAGPGGLQWRHPAKIGMNFLHSLGWTGEKAFRRLEDQMDVKMMPEQLMIQNKPHNQYTTPEEALTGGIEVVPLMARRRSFKKTSHLPSCDVTNLAIAHRKEVWQDDSGPTDYLRDLDTQVSNKKCQVKAEKEEDVKAAQRHLETWNSLWGRPGHGAPRAGGDRSKGHLGRLLYREPGVLWPAGPGAKVR